MFEVEGKTYVLKYSQSRIGMFENTTGKSFMELMVNSKGMLSLNDLKMLVAFALKEEGSDVFVATRTAVNMAEQLVETNGYMTVCSTVLKQVENDCPFLFQAN